MSQYILRFQGFARTAAWCHVVVLHTRGETVVLVGELDDNPGTSTNNAIEPLAATIADHLLDGDRRFALYQYDPQGLPNLEPTFYKVTWNGQPGTFSMPTWDVVDPQADPWLRHIAGTVTAQNYSLDHLLGHRHLELIDATRNHEDLRWAV